MSPFLRTILTLTLASICGAWPAWGQSLSLTFDDGLTPQTQPQASAWNARIITDLHDAGITAMVFPSLVRIGGQPGLDLIRDRGQAGHAVGNHTATHRSLSSPQMSLDDFITDVTTADAALRELPTWVPMLRFPYLKEGSTAEKRDGFRAWGRAFVSARAAFDDPLYALQPDTLPAGESVVWALAKAQGVADLRYPAEDAVYEEPALRTASLLP